MQDRKSEDNRKDPSSEEWSWFGKEIVGEKHDYAQEDIIERQHKMLLNSLMLSFRFFMLSGQEKNQKSKRKNKPKAILSGDDLLKIARPQSQWCFFPFAANEIKSQKNNAGPSNESTELNFFQAVLDGELKKVDELLKAYPGLSRAEPQNLVLKSTLTHRKFHAKNALTMAVELKKIKMIELLLSHYNRLEQTDDVRKAKVESLLSWTLYKTQKLGQDQIIIPDAYKKDAESLIALSITAASYENLKRKEKNKESIKELDYKICDIEHKLSSLMKKLLPDEVAKLEDFDVNLFYLAFIRAFRDKVDKNTDEKFKKLKGNIFEFCVPIMNFLQTAFESETAEIFCEGLHKMVLARELKQEVEISPKATAYILKNGEPFYSPLLDSDRRLTPKSACGTYGEQVKSKDLGAQGILSCHDFEKLCLFQEQRFLEIKQQNALYSSHDELDEFSSEQDEAGSKQYFGCTII